MNKPESSEMVLVPREPTPEMLIAGESAWRHNLRGTGVAEAYRAMIAAHPSNQVLQEPRLAEFPAQTLADIAEGLEKGYPRAYDVGDECPEVESTTAYAARFIRAYLVPLLPEQPIAEQPKSEQPNSVYLGSAGPSEDLQAATPGHLRAQQERIRQSVRRAAFAKVGAELFLERVSDDMALVRIHIGHLSFGIGQPRNGTEAASVLRTFRDALTDLLIAAKDAA